MTAIAGIDFASYAIRAGGGTGLSAYVPAGLFRFAALDFG
jgi:hypothetical protein